MKKTSLFLERSKGESVFIGEGSDRVEITVQRIRENNVTLAFNAPRSVKINRAERGLENQQDE